VSLPLSLLLHILRDSPILSEISKWILAMHIMIDSSLSRSGQSLATDDDDDDDTDVSRNQNNISKHPPKSPHTLICKLVWMEEEGE